jgi:3-hydroxyanthranilate 3,4-dioxygenase
MFTPVNLNKWIDENRHLLQPPVSNKCIWVDDRESIIMIVGGPNCRNDYHINCTEEFFYQVQGDITVRIIHPDTGKPHDIIIREGEVYLLPKNVPHSPMRPANTVGLVVEQPRPAGGPQDILRWYCPGCHGVVHEDHFTLENIAVDLKEIMATFWASDELRTCKGCGQLMPEPTEAQPPAQA